MEELILFILATAGLTWIVVLSTIFKPLREKMSKDYSGKFLTQLINCTGCFGFWAAGIIFILMHYHVDILVRMFAGSIISFSIFTLLSFIQRK